MLFLETNFQWQHSYTWTVPLPLILQSGFNQTHHRWNTHTRQGFMSFTADKGGGNTLFPIILGKFLLIWFIRVKSAKITFMLYCHGEYSMAINVTHQGSHFFAANTSAWDNGNLGIIQSAISLTGRCRATGAWDALPRFFKGFVLPVMHFFLYYPVTQWSLNSSHLGFLDTHTRYIEK